MSLPCLALWTIPQSSARHDPFPNLLGIARGIYVTVAERRVVVLHVFAKGNRCNGRNFAGYSFSSRGNTHGPMTSLR